MHTHSPNKQKIFRESFLLKRNTLYGKFYWQNLCTRSHRNIGQGLWTCSLQGFLGLEVLPFDWIQILPAAKHLNALQQKSPSEVQQTWLDTMTVTGTVGDPCQDWWYWVLMWPSRSWSAAFWLNPHFNCHQIFNSFPTKKQMWQNN